MRIHNKIIRKVLNLVCACTLLGAGSSLNAATLVNQQFDLPNGSIVQGSDDLWQHRSGAEGDLVVNEGALQISSSASEDVGILLGDQTFGESSEDTLYASFTLKIVDLPTAGGGYFAHFRGGSSSSFRGRLFIAASDEGGVQLGISNGGSKFSDSSALPQNLELGKEYRIVLSYEPSKAVTKLGIDPALESDLVTVATDSVSVKSINQFAVRQASGIGTLEIDHLKISTEFSELSANAGPQEPTLKIQSNQKVLPERGEPSFFVVLERTGSLDVSLILDLVWSGSAENGTDYVLGPDSITFSVGQGVIEIESQIIDDNLKEGSETIELEVILPENINLSGENTLLWEIHDDDLTTVSLSSSVQTVTEGVDDIFEIYLDRRGDLSTELNVDWSFHGSAEKGVDLDWSTPFSASFSPGQDRVAIEFLILNDSVAELHERVEFQLLPSESYQQSGETLIVEILNDDLEGMYLDEPFDYEDGPLLQASLGRWNHTSGTENEMEVFSGQLDLNELSGEDVVVELPVPGPDVEVPEILPEVFAGMDLFVAKAPEGDGNYWAHFRGSTSSTFKGRVFARRGGAGEDTIELGISNGQAEADIWFPMEWPVPVKLRLVVGYQPTDGVTRLWINPDNIDDAHVVAFDETSTPKITGFAFRQPASRSNGMGRFLLDHLKISTEWADVVHGGTKPYLYWDFSVHETNVAEVDQVLDSVEATVAIVPESLIPSRDLFLRRIGVTDSELWANFDIQGDISLGEDLSILQGTGPVLVRSGESEGVLNLAPIMDSQVEEDELLTLTLMASDGFQVGFPNKALLMLEDTPVSVTAPEEPLTISIFAQSEGGSLSISLHLHGEQNQNYLVEISHDLVTWDNFATGKMNDQPEIISLGKEEFSQAFLRARYQNP